MGAAEEAAADPRDLQAPARRPALLGAYDVGRDRLYGHIKKRKTRVEFLAFCRYIRSLYPAEMRLDFILDNFSPHLGDKVREWAADNNVELAHTPHYGSWLSASRPSSKRCATSPSTAPTTPITPPRPGSSAATSPGATTTPTTPAYARSSTRQTLPDPPLAVRRQSF